MGKPKFDWTAFAAASHDWPPRPLLLKALSMLGPGDARQALDLGTSSGRDALAMAERGWQVLAIDADQTAVQTLEQRILDDLSGRLTVRHADLASYTLPEADLIHAGYTLPFLGDQAVYWQRITRALAPGGVFVGQFFGSQDEWADEPQVTTIKRHQLGQLIHGWHRLHYEEKLFNAPAQDVADKRWHLFNVILRKPRIPA